MAPDEDVTVATGFLSDGGGPVVLLQQDGEFLLILKPAQARAIAGGLNLMADRAEGRAGARDIPLQHRQPRGNA